MRWSTSWRWWNPEWRPIAPHWTKERRLAALEFADQVAMLRCLRIQCVDHVFALTLTDADSAASVDTNIIEVDGKV